LHFQVSTFVIIVPLIRLLFNIIWGICFPFQFNSSIMFTYLFVSYLFIHLAFVIYINF
jgi:hypothetical protein